MYNPFQFKIIHYFKLKKGADFVSEFENLSGKKQKQVYVNTNGQAAKWPAQYTNNQTAYLSHRIHANKCSALKW